MITIFKISVVTIYINCYILILYLLYYPQCNSTETRYKMPKKLTEQEKQFADKVRKYRKLKVKEAELRQELESLKSDIVEYLELCDNKHADGNGFSITASTRTRYTFDKDMLAEALPGQDLKQFQKPMSYIVLMVK